MTVGNDYRGTKSKRGPFYDYLPSVTVAQLRRDGLIKKPYGCELTMSLGGKAETVKVTSIPGVLGGTYPMFICPKCGNRAKKLYFVNWAGYHGFGCRGLIKKCLDLPYKSWHEGAKQKALRRARKVIAREEAKRSFNYYLKSKQNPVDRPGVGHVPRFTGYPDYKLIPGEAETAMDTIIAEEEGIYAAIAEIHRIELNRPVGRPRKHRETQTAQEAAKRK